MHNSTMCDQPNCKCNGHWPTCHMSTLSPFIYKCINVHQKNHEMDTKLRDFVRSITLKKLRQIFFSSLDGTCVSSVCCDCVADVTCVAFNVASATVDESCELSGIGVDIAAASGGGGAVELLNLRFPDICADNTSLVPFIQFR